MESVTVPGGDGMSLHVGVVGDGPDVVVLSGGPGCVNYLEHDALAPEGTRAWFPEPRGVGRSGGGAHDLTQAVDDLETIRATMGVDSWTVLGHSFGSDLGVRYALDYPERVHSVVGIAGHGLHKDRTWSQIYSEHRHVEDSLVITWDAAVHESLNASFIEWIHQPTLFRQLADTPVRMSFVAAGEDIRPDWPLRQLAALIPRGQFRSVRGVPHNFWHTHPETWTALVSELCRGEVIVQAADIDEPGVADVLALAIGDDPQKIRATVDRYRNDPAVTLLLATDRGMPVGAVGYTPGAAAITILHIATVKSARRMGLGRRLLAEVRRAAPAGLPLVAETDADAVGFYAATGFTVTPLGEKYPGRQRFHAHLDHHSS
ncbi:hypothetical protein MSZK_60030 [Mycobacterium sp. shizuoka-1]|nr:hypothetical protein MSZK_60030 [Mycobacterium sp. shizuoka-1]